MSTALVFEKLVQALAETARRLYGERLVSLVIFGSLGRGTARADSDIDLLLVATDLPKGRMKRVVEFDRVEKELEPALDEAKLLGVTTRFSAVFKTPEEARRGSPLFLDMVEDARLVVDRGGFFAGVLQGLRGKLDRLGSRRIWCGARWYWDLKPDYKPGDVIEL